VHGLAAAKLATLEIWDERLIEFGSEIIDQRVALIGELGAPLAAAYHSIVDADHRPELRPLLSVDGADIDGDVGFTGFETPHSSAPQPVGASAFRPAETRTRFADAMRRLRTKELERGVTLVGPHRDAVVLLLNGLPAKGYASHGESWSFVLALRLASAELLRRDSSTGDPVLVLDDVFAELDEERRHRLAGAVADFEQVLITAAVAADVPDDLHPRIVRIQSGEVLEQRDGAR
jgi:DNA replication and repair protein RecF